MRNNLHFTKLPDEFGMLSSLTRLYLNHHKMEKLPNSFGMLTNLQILDLSSTYWDCPILCRTEVEVIDNEVERVCGSLANCCTGDSTFDDTFENDYALLPCGVGFSGNKTRQCNSGVFWGSVIDNCSENVCPAQDGYPQTLQSQYSTKQGECSPGFSKKRYCNTDGTWGSESDNCVDKNAVLLEMASQLATQVGVKWQPSTYDSISQLLDVVYSRIDRNIKDVKAAMNKKAGQYREEFEGIMHKVTSEKDDTIARAEKVAKDASEESKARIANAEAAVEAAERLLLPRREAVAKAEASSKEAQNGLQLAKAALQAREDDVASARAALQRAKDTAAQGRQRNRQEEERAQAGAKKAKKQAIKIASEMAQAAMKAQRDAVNGKMSALMSELYLVKRIRMLIDNGEDPGPASAAQQQEWESWAKLPEEMTGSSGSTGASGATGAMNMDTASGATGFSGTGSENDEIEKLEKAMA